MSGLLRLLVRVPQNLCARIPDAVDDESAAFTVVASIALQGLRLAAPTLGESVAVIGVGLIGLLTVTGNFGHGLPQTPKGTPVT